MEVELCDALGVEREEVGLNLLGDGELVREALFFLLFLEEAREGAGHRVEGAAEFGELVVAGDGDAMAKVAAIDVLGCLVEVGDGFGDGAAEAKSHP